MGIALVRWFWRRIAGCLVDDGFGDLCEVAFFSCLACSARHASSLTVGSGGVNANYFF